MTQKAFAQGSEFPPTSPGRLRLYSMRLCPFAQRTRLVLAYKNISFETVNINLKSKPDWFLTLNPLGQVPVLQIDDKVIPESTATCDWLDEVYTENRLTPADPYRRAWDRVLLEYLSKLQGVAFKMMRADGMELTMAIEERDKHLTYYEQKLVERGDGPFFGGDKPAMIDFLLWPIFERIPAMAALKGSPAAGIDPERFPRLTSLIKAMWELPAVKATGFAMEKHVKYFQGYMSGTPDFDMFLEE